MKTQRVFLFVCGLLLGGFVACTAFSQKESPSPTAKGTLDVGGTKHSLSYAYAVPERKKDILVILSDQPLKDTEIKDVFERIHRVEAGELHLVEISLDAERTPTSVSVRHKALMSRGGGFSSEDTFEPRKSEKGTVAGRFYRKSPGEFDGVTFTYDVTFTAPIWKEPPPTFSGEAARKSPQARVAMAFLKAGKAGDLKGLKKLVESGSIADLEGPMGKEILEMMKLGPDPSKLKLTRVDVDGETARVRYEQKTRESTETTTINLRLEAGEWKVSQR